MLILDVCTFSNFYFSDIQNNIQIIIYDLVLYPYVWIELDALMLFLSLSLWVYASSSYSYIVWVQEIWCIYNFYESVTGILNKFLFYLIFYGWGFQFNALILKL